MKFSIVTPVYNSARFLRETALSVVTQSGDFDIEYIVVDNLSSDNSLEIIESLKTITVNQTWCNSIEIKVISENDKGMYDALSKGFSIATGDIYAYINSDDIYLPGSFITVFRVFNSTSAEWIKGITSYIDQNSTITAAGSCYLYNRQLIGQGLYGRVLYFIQQDSVFWKAGLWRKSGGINASLKMAGDYDLWIKFSKHSELVSINAHLSCFRKHNHQLTSDMSKYYEECSNVKSVQNTMKFRLFFRSIEPRLPKKLRPFFYEIFIGPTDYYYVDMRCKDLSITRTNYYLTS